MAVTNIRICNQFYIVIYSLSFGKTTFWNGTHMILVEFKLFVSLPLKFGVQMWYCIICKLRLVSHYVLLFLIDGCANFFPFTLLSLNSNYQIVVDRHSGRRWW